MKRDQRKRTAKEEHLEERHPDVDGRIQVQYSWRKMEAAAEE